MNPIEPFTDLASAVVSKAVDDYVNLSVGLAKEEETGSSRNDLLRFFHSDWCHLLSGLDPDAMMKGVNRQIERSRRLEYLVVRRGEKYAVVKAGGAEGESAMEVYDTEHSAVEKAAGLQGIPVVRYKRLVRRDEKRAARRKEPV